MKKGASFLFWAGFAFSMIGPPPWAFIAYAIGAMAWVHDLYFEPEDA